MCVVAGTSEKCGQPPPAEEMPMLLRIFVQFLILIVVRKIIQAGDEPVVGVLTGGMYTEAVMGQFRRAPLAQKCGICGLLQHTSHSLAL